MPPKNEQKESNASSQATNDPVEQLSRSGNNSPVPASSLPVRKRKQAITSAQNADKESDPKSITFSLQDDAVDRQTSSVSNYGEGESDSDDDKHNGNAKDHAVAVKDEAEGSIDNEDDQEKGPNGKVREIRLEQNRKAARESRRRKKMMIEELQRSVIFFSKRNAVLKKENDDLTRMLIQAQAQNQSGAAAKQPKQEGGQQSAAAAGPSVAEQQEAADAQAMQQMLLNQINAANNAIQQSGQGKTEANPSNGGGKSTHELQAAAIQAMAAARNVLPQPGTFGFDAQGNPITNPFGQFMGQQLQAGGQQFFPMMGGQAGGIGASGASYGIPFPYGSMPQQHLFQFPGAGSQGMANLLQQQQTGQQQQQQQQQGGQQQ
mmetsp:Transcript_3858/g.5741  ORF Transcript_3858/g.5741 Transcript_3858/m.5741 type:complete len:376 (-) Transcript_3858:889-2016(-)|eukprot:CAMPEP_0172416906 /NCGR_PEP_ID=MMETSP1064-20121228/3401_1 /TAXON_ID=202472 /ORGANISM="Aulacoseira subarctica , Strain CCAP 1002/5" /LENGTH=375 /DNA_ID=CAMNT_0013154877 /DNA_START=601 /DNA_END=1728 /DNA_ORIENTATION=+